MDGTARKFGEFMQQLFQDGEFPEVLVPGHDYFETGIEIIKSLMKENIILKQRILNPK